jgi:mannose-1-phosphate guanylyltransferase
LKKTLLPIKNLIDQGCKTVYKLYTEGEIALTAGLLVSCELYTILLSGGIGKRLWPISQEHHPKQFLSAEDIPPLRGKHSSELSFFQSAFKRAQAISPRVIIVSSINFANLIESQLQELEVELSQEDILLEPCIRNTAGSVIISALHAKKFGDPLLVYLPTDHIIGDDEYFVQIIQSVATQLPEEPYGNLWQRLCNKESD